MTFIDKIKNKQADLSGNRQVTIAFLGDSVTHGCFELGYHDVHGAITIHDLDFVYHNRVRQIMHMLYPTVPFTFVNAGIGGESAPMGEKRLERDVLSYRPDLTVVCFGLNDSGNGKKRVDEYINALRSIFIRLRESGSAVIFMTPNVRGERVNERIINEKARELATEMCTPELTETMDLYMDKARELCSELNVPVCDCYDLWKKMSKAGVDVTSLLSNDINHPTRDMHYLFAIELVKVMLGGKV